MENDKPQRIIILATAESECNSLRDNLAGVDASVETQLIRGDFLTVDADADVCVISMPEHFRPVEGESHYTLHVPGALLLYVFHLPDDDARQWAFRHGAADVLGAPYTAEALRDRVQRLLHETPEYVDNTLREENLLLMLRDFSEREIEFIEPVLEPGSPAGHYFPDVARHTGRSRAESACLERLASEGLLLRELTEVFRLCPLCNDFRLAYRENCPYCESLNIVQTEMIHHFACGHIGPKVTFQRESQLVCPKCEQAVRHIGLEYEKPTGYFHCRSCDSVISEPDVEAKCVACATTCDPRETIEQPVYRYQMTPLVDEAIREGRVGGANLTSLLRSKHTGLYSRQYFEREVERELIRTQRYNEPFSLMLVRLDNLEAVRKAHAAQAGEYTTSIFKALSRDLRNLDATCVWDTDTLGVLLPNTPPQGAKIVAERMHREVDALDYLRSIQEPSITVAVVSGTDEYANARDMIAAAESELRDEG